MTDSTLPLDAPEPAKPRARTGRRTVEQIEKDIEKMLVDIANSEDALQFQIEHLRRRRDVVIEIRDRILNKGDDEG